MSLFNKKKAEPLAGPSVVNKWFSLESVRTIGCGSFMLVPYDAMWFNEVLDADSMMLHLLGNSKRISDFFRIDFSSQDKVKQFLQGAMLSVEIGVSITYVIRAQNYPLGVIIVNTPTKSFKTFQFKEWTLDFFMLDGFENKGYMTSALPRILKVLKEQMHVDEVYFIVDPRNEPCLSLLEKFPIEEIIHRPDGQYFYSKRDGVRARLLCCDLSTIVF